MKHLHYTTKSSHTAMHLLKHLKDNPELKKDLQSSSGNGKVLLKGTLLGCEIELEASSELLSIEINCETKSLKKFKSLLNIAGVYRLEKTNQHGNTAIVLV